MWRLVNTKVSAIQDTVHDQSIIRRLIRQIKYILNAGRRRQAEVDSRNIGGMVRMGMEMKYRKYYIMGTDRRLFSNVSVWEPRHNSYQ